MRTWSFSSMSTFDNCPKQYELTYVRPVIPYQETEATLWGTAVHEALEHYARDGVPLKEKFLPYKKYADKILSLPGEPFFEREFALTRNLEPCDFKAPNAWCRGIIDIGVIHNEKAFAGDWKTGKVRPDSDQLMLFAGFVLHTYPQVESVKTAYIWLASGKITSKTYTRGDLSAIWEHFIRKAERLEGAYVSDRWHQKPSGLCNGWCGAGRANCNFWSPRRK